MTEWYINPILLDNKDHVQRDEGMTTNGRPREFKKEAVIDATMDVFWSKGYEASSTQELCEKTGLGKGSLYNAFGGKNELFEQVLQRYNDEGLEISREILGRSVPVKERLHALFEWAIGMDFRIQIIAAHGG